MRSITTNYIQAYLPPEGRRWNASSAADATVQADLGISAVQLRNMMRGASMQTRTNLTFREWYWQATEQDQVRGTNINGKGMTEEMLLRATLRLIAWDKRLKVESTLLDDTAFNPGGGVGAGAEQWEEQQYYRCLPGLMLLGVSKCGTTDVFDRPVVEIPLATDHLLEDTDVLLHPLAKGAAAAKQSISDLSVR